MFKYCKCILILAVLGFGCSSNSSTHIDTGQQVVEKLLNDSIGLFKRDTLGLSSSKKVLNTIPDSLTVVEEDRIKTTCLLNDSCRIETAYVFEQSTLQSLESLVYLATELQSIEVVEALRDSLVSKYGEESSEGDFLIWKTQNSNRQKIRIALINESNEHGFSLVSLSYFLEN